MQMSMKSYGNLEITGSIMEVPRAKEPSLPRTIEKKTILPLDLGKKRSSILLSKAITSSSRSISQLSQNNNKKPAPSQNLEEEINKLKRRIDELEQQLKSSQKFGKEKEKTIEELNKKLNNCIKQETFLNEKLMELQKSNDNLKSENDRLTMQLLTNEDERRKNADRIKEEILKLKLEQENEINRLKEEHSKEIKLKDEKLDLLKKQIAGAFKDNSWERQLQIDELTKELKRTQEEYDLIKHKLKSLKNKNEDSCQNCSGMHEKLEEKTLTIRENEIHLAELVNLMKKFQNQINFSDELLKLTNGHRFKMESLRKLSPNVSLTKSKSIKK